MAAYGLEAGYCYEYGITQTTLAHNGWNSRQHFQVQIAMEPKTSHADTSTDKDEIFSFIPPPPDIEAIRKLNFIPPIPDVEATLVYIPPAPNVEAPPIPDVKAIIDSIPPAPNVEATVLDDFIPPPPEINIIPKDVLSEIQKFIHNQNLIHPEPITKLNENVIPPETLSDLQQKIPTPSVQADYSFGTSDYYFTWFHNLPKFTYFQAQRFCHSLPGNWHVVSIESLPESHQISNIVAHYNLRFIWIGAKKQNGAFRFWDSGEKFFGINFSHTGRYKTPQPDNAELKEKNIPEDCLSILDHFYPGDGMTWHDIACYHEKVTICERPRFR